MNWTTPAQLHGQVQRLWDKGAILAEQAGAASCFPYRLTLKSPTASEIGADFAAVRAWAQALQASSGLRLEYRSFRHRLFGDNCLPSAAWVETPAEACRLLGKTREAGVFAALVASTVTQQPSLRSWLQKYPLRALDHAADWPQLLALIGWLQARPRPGCYLRQIDLPGIDSKFVETRRGLLAELLDLALPPEAIDTSASGNAGFNRRYGFRDKPERIRCRFLDPTCAPLPALAGADLTLDSASFAALAPAVERVFICENEVNFLAFPPVDRGFLIFGAGYGLAALAQAGWLQSLPVYYWGDLDTHGFAILDELRQHLPQARSLLMDETTLLEHRARWGHEASPTQRPLSHLNADELATYTALIDHTHGPSIRLEQERLPFSLLQDTLSQLP